MDDKLKLENQALRREIYELRGLVKQQMSVIRKLTDKEIGNGIGARHI